MHAIGADRVTTSKTLRTKQKCNSKYNIQKFRQEIRTKKENKSHSKSSPNEKVVFHLVLYFNIAIYDLVMCILVAPSWLLRRTGLIVLPLIAHEQLVGSVCVPPFNSIIADVGPKHLATWSWVNGKIAGFAFYILRSQFATAYWTRPLHQPSFACFICVAALIQC